MKKKPLIETNPYLRDPVSRRKSILNTVMTSSKIEGIRGLDKMKIKALSDINHNQFKAGDVFEWPDKAAKRLIELGAAEKAKFFECKNVKKPEPEPEKVTEATPSAMETFIKETPKLAEIGPLVAGEEFTLGKDLEYEVLPEVTPENIDKIKTSKPAKKKEPKKSRTKKKAKANK
jgi:hypothetical protein